MQNAADNALSPAAQRARQPILDCNIIRIFGWYFDCFPQYNQVQQDMAAPRAAC
jgi:hypothetical protein